MNILYSGDSWTWGGELDGLDKNHGYRIANRFSSVVGHPHVNIGSNGWSNEMISRSVVDYIESNENTIDFVIAQFTLPNRYAVYDERKGCWFDIHPSTALMNIINKNIPLGSVRAFYKTFHNDVYATNEFWRSVLSLETYLENKNIPYYFMRFEMKGNELRDDVNCPYKKASSNKNMIEICDSIIGKHLKTTKPRNANFCPDLSHVDPMYGGGHPSANGHKLIAQHLQGILPK